MNNTLPPLIETPPGRYRHYRGGLYEVIGTARHSETLEPMTLYRKCGSPPVSKNRGQIPISGAATGDALHSKLESDPDFCLWVRPAAMFNEWVSVEGGTPQPRFALISDENRL
ncbi:MAG: DUF1653 domain-containing protein [Burkholderiaceae bacterium]|nr:DUF1653 domain-containing protein [Burkholderiaceae bacterium]